MEILGLHSIAKEVIDILKSIKDRYDACQGNLPSATALEGTYQRLAERLQSMSVEHRETISSFSKYNAAYFEERFGELNITFSAAAKQLTTQLKKLEHPLYRTALANHIEDMLSTLQQDANQAKQKLDEIQNTLGLASLIPRSEVTDCFQYCNTAPPNEAVVVLDFESLDDKGIPLTCEGRLKAAILASSDGESVGAVASGMGGVGKTCTLRALARHPEIIKRFPGGVLLMSLGKDATVADLIERLCSAVEATGGKQLADELRRETGLTTVIEKTRNWFYNHICLFMIDDVWCSKSSNNIKPDILKQLLIIAGNSGQEGGSRLVYSTRDKNLTVLGKRIHFKPKESQGTLASRILLRYAEASENELHDPTCEKAIENILNMCAGLPVALSVAGRAVCWKRENWQGDRRECWVAYWSEMEKNGILDEPAGVYGNLRRSLMVSLDYLDEQRDTSASGMTTFSYKVWSLLLSPQWIVKMIETSAILRLEEDIAMCTRGREDDNRARALNMVGRAARLSVSDCVEAPDCVWFQLYARLFVIAQRCKTTRRFLEGIEATAPRPWLKPIRLCIRGASDALLNSYVVSGSVTDVQILDEEDAVAYGYRVGREETDIWIVKQHSGAERSKLRLQCDADADITTRNRIMSADRREHRVSRERSIENVSILARRFYGGWRQIICCWKGSTSESSGNSVQPSTSEQNQSSNASEPRRRGIITCLAIGKDGRCVVAGDSNGLVRVWDIATGLP